MTVMRIPLRWVAAFIVAMTATNAPVNAAGKRPVPSTDGALLLGAGVDPAAQQHALARARELLQMLIDGRYDAFLAESTEKVRGALPADKLQQVWEGTQAQMGAFGAERDVRVQRNAGATTVVFSLCFERGDLAARFILDAEGRLAGLWFAPDTSRVTYDPPDYVDREAFREEEVTVSAGRYPLPGTLAIPKADRPERGFCGVVLVHGSGAHDQDETVYANKPFRDLAWGLASRGIAVLRYEKRTHKYPGAHGNDDITLHDETIDDAVAAARLLRRHAAVDPGRVFVLGHSLGAVAAPFIARDDPDLAGIILLAGCSRPLTEVIEEQVEYLVGLDGEVTAEEQQELDRTRRTLAEVRAGQLDGEPAVLPRRYLHMLKRYDPVEAARSLTLPVLIVQGGRDYQVTMKDWALWRQGLKDRANVTFRLFDKCNHLFAAGEGPSSPEEYMTAGHMAEEVITVLAGWITQGAG